MDERRTGGIVAAVTITITAAFIAVMLLFLNESVDVACRYAESSTDLFAFELETDLSMMMHGSPDQPDADPLDSSSGHVYSRIMDEHNTQGMEALCFDDVGRIVFGTSGAAAAGTNVFEAYPAVADIRSQLSEDTMVVSRAWVGLEGLLPRDQKLYMVHYSSELGLYLLVTNTARAIFDEMRARDTTIILALVVVMVLLLLLVMAIVRSYRARLIKAATTDELTGLANRKSFVSGYEAFVSSRAKGGATLALVDVDLFKHINDTFGHATGDRALAAVAGEMRALVGNDGLAGRWGGDEFIGVLLGPEGEAHERIRAMIERVAALDLGSDVHVSVSVGATTIDVEQPLERMVEQADDALYVTKENGRGFLTPYREGSTPHIAYQHVEGGKKGDASARPAVVGPQPPRERVLATSSENRRRLLELVVQSLLDAVRHMVPFVAGGGILIAIAFLIDGASVDINSLSAESRADFGSITPIAAGLRDVGSAAFNFMLPIFAAFFARGLAGDEAFMAGFAGGFLASQGTAGFAGAICAAFVAAAVVQMMRGFMEETSESLRRVAPVLLYPVFSLLIMYLLMTFAIDPAASAFDGRLTSMLEVLAQGSRVVLGMVCGAMMGTDLGGPINKAAYHFGTASIASGSSDIMAAVMVGGMVPPCGIALCMWIFRNRFTATERDQAAATLFMGLAFITEGAIPFALTDLLRVIPACMVGSAVAGGLSMSFGCTLLAPHGGIFVFPVVGDALLYLVSLVLGSLVTAVVLGMTKRPVGPVA